MCVVCVVCDCVCVVFVVCDCVCVVCVVCDCVCVWYVWCVIVYGVLADMQTIINVCVQMRVWWFEVVSCGPLTLLVSCGPFTLLVSCGPFTLLLLLLVLVPAKWSLQFRSSLCRVQGTVWPPIYW